MGITTVKQLVRRIEETDPETAVKMLQTMFLTYGKTDMAYSNVYIVGDAEKPGRIVNAVHNAFQLARSI